MFWYSALAICLVALAVAWVVVSEFDYFEKEWVLCVSLCVIALSFVSILAFGFASFRYAVGERGGASRTGVVVSVGEEGIIWRTKYLRLVTANADGTFASNGHEFRMSVLAKEYHPSNKDIYKDAIKAMNEKRVVKVTYNYKADDPWIADHETRVLSIE